MAIDAWLLRVARAHIAIPGKPNGSCCNNHYYRRSLYAAALGVLTGSDDLFQSGAEAIHSALDGAMPDGALPLEMKRGELEPHYQNFALMYLAMIAEIMERQGYPAWEIEVGGKTLHDLVAFNNRVLARPETVLRHATAETLSLRYRDDDQYFAWFELYLARFPNAEMEGWIANRRPLYNRSLGGFLTAYFYAG